MNLFLPSDPRPVHFVGIAGAGMSALAMLALRRGVSVTGSDRSPEGAPDLPRLGAKVLQDHDPRSVDGARAVIASAAIPADHPELVRARELGLPVVSRKVALGQLVADGRTVAIAGTHGKTTTTVMTTEALAAAGFDPTGLAGGRVDTWGGNARIGSDRLFVVEADEYDQAFLELHPEVALINNVEPEHLECYGGSAEVMEQAFAAFAGRATTVLAGNADAGTERVVRLLEAMPSGPRLWRFGPGARDLNVLAVRAGPGGSEAEVRVPDGRTMTLSLMVPGMHNVRNALGALGAVAALGGSLEPAAAALARFAGVGRRFEVRGQAGGVTVVDDYAHHATEVEATLSAARQAYPHRRIVAAFQPHLYSRTAVQAEALGRVLAGADLVFVTEVYAAREEPVPGVSGANVVHHAVQAGGDARFTPTRRDLLERVLAAVQPGDVVLTLGAGDITTLGPALLARLPR
jgi:UDP-N-acetylmuramate--alanine ligase